MPNFRTQQPLFLSLVLALAGCVTPAVEPQLQGPDQPVAIEAVPRATSLTVTITAAPPPNTYRTQYLQVADWEQATATLSNTDATVNTTISPATKSANASLNSANQRSATFSFGNLRPAASYALSISLLRHDPAGQLVIIAAGANTGFTLNPGANTQTVTLSLDPTNGKVVVNVPAPLLPNTAAVDTAITTNSGFSVRRVAGSTIAGDAAGTDPLTATFTAISGLDVAPDGTMLVTEKGHYIRKITPAGAVKVAGTGVPGNATEGAVANTSAINDPHGLTRDPVSGTVVFADTQNGRVKRVTPDGLLFTDAGGGTVTTFPAPARNAQLGSPWGVAVDAFANIFFTDIANGNVCRIDGNWQLTKLATLGTSASAIAIDRTNKVLWVASGNQIYPITGITTAPVVGPAIFTAQPTGSNISPLVVALAFDQVGTLYATQTSTPVSGVANTADTLIWRIPVALNGTMVAGRSAEAIAGNGGTSANAPDFDVPAAAALFPATTRLLSGTDFTALFVDMSQSGSATTLGGILYCGNSYQGSYGEILQLVPAAFP